MDIKEKLHKIKYSRLSPEELFLYPIFWKLEECYFNHIPNSIFYKNRDGILFRYEPDKNNFWYHFELIWEILKNKYGIDINTSNKLISEMGDAFLGLKNIKSFPGQTLSLL